MRLTGRFVAIALAIVLSGHASADARERLAQATPAPEQAVPAPSEPAAPVPEQPPAPSAPDRTAPAAAPEQPALTGLAGALAHFTEDDFSETDTGITKVAASGDPRAATII